MQFAQYLLWLFWNRFMSYLELLGWFGDWWLSFWQLKSLSFDYKLLTQWFVTPCAIRSVNQTWCMFLSSYSVTVLDGLCFRYLVFSRKCQINSICDGSNFVLYVSLISPFYKHVGMLSTLYFKKLQVVFNSVYNQLVNHFSLPKQFNQLCGFLVGWLFSSEWKMCWYSCADN